MGGLRVRTVGTRLVLVTQVERSAEIHPVTSRQCWWRPARLSRVSLNGFLKIGS